MRNDLTSLRQKAREIRDVTIARARQRYEHTITTIGEREKASLAKAPKGTLQAYLDRVIPRDRQFTVSDLLSALKAMDGKYRWLRHSVERHVCRLRIRGLVRRLKKSSNHDPAIYVWNGLAVNERPFRDKTLVEVATEVLGNRSVTIVELTIAILEAGYETAMTKKALHIALGTVLRENERFKRQVARWSV